MVKLMDQAEIINKFDTFMLKHKMKYIDKKDRTGAESEKPTHTFMGGPKGSYRIPDEKYSKFIQLYKEAVKAGADLYVVERNREVGPLIVDIDFKSEIKERQYKESHIKDITKRYINTIKKYFDVSKDDLTSLIFEKSGPTCEIKDESKLYKDGFHIEFPDITLDVKCRYFLYHLILEDAQDDNPFEDLDLDESSPLEKIFDDSVIIDNGLLMFGSHKEGREPYNLTHVYNHALKDLDVNNFSTDEIIDMTLLRRCADDDALDFNPSLDEDKIMEQVNTVYQMYSSKGKNKSKKPKDGGEIQKSNKTSARSEKDGREVFHSQDHIVKMARRITSVLSPKRARDYDSWIRVGWALHNVDDSLLDAYIEFSKKCPKKFQEGACEKVWREATFSGLTLASLVWWVKEDNRENPNVYDEILAECVGENIIKALSGTHDDIANSMYELYRDTFKCTDLEKNIWYEFSGHRWELRQSGYTLFEKISDDLSKRFAYIASARVRYASAEELNAQKGDFSVINAQKTIKLCDNLKNVTFKEKVLKACRCKFYDNKLEEKLDSNIYLIGFDNGVYDLTTGKFRNGAPDDYIKMSVGYNYKEFDENHPTITKIKTYFLQVQRDSKMRNYVLRFISSCLDGSTKDQKFFIWTGSGANGKSTTEKLIKHTFGDYFKTMPNEVMTRKSGAAGRAKPELADKRGVRLIMMNEPEGDDTLGVSKLKEFSGGEDIDARALYGNTFYFKPQFKMVLACNKLPTIKARDGGTWRRILVTPWGSKFVDYEPKKENEFKMDKHLMDNIATWNQAFMWLLVNKIYPEYAKHGLGEPDEVTEHTRKYKKDSDFYCEFLDEWTVQDEDAEESLPLLYEAFKQWYRESYNEKPPAKKEFVEYLSQKEVPIERNVIKGMKIIRQGENAEEAR